MVFYRKYRPQKIEDLDSKDVREKLYSVLKSPSISHAFLFTGPKGLGKTSTARIVAKVLNCERDSKLKSQKSKLQVKSQKLEDMEPCNKCDQCIWITNGTNLDVLEIDGASNRGIDEIRDLREKVKLSPLAARKKVYIIDEVHMLTQEAFNALLKTLEEPPSHVVFILCTTEPHKVPATIVSRCLHIQFEKATTEELIRSFERIIKGEKLKGETEALSLIATLSDGSFRDGTKILEEMAVVSKDKKITKDLVEQKYQILTIHHQITQMIRHLENRDTKSALESVVKLTSSGAEMGHFIQELIRTLHNNLLFKAGVDSAIQNFAGQGKLEIEEIKRLIELLSRAYGELKYAVLPQIPLELAIVEWGLSVGESTQAGTVVARGPVASLPATPLKEANSFIRSTNAPSAGSVRVVGSPSSGSTPRSAIQQNISAYNGNDVLWTALIDKVKAYNHSIAGVLRGCSVKSYNEKTLLIETNFKFHKDKLSEIKTLGILEKACQEITKKNIKVSVVLKGGEKLK